MPVCVRSEHVKADELLYIVLERGDTDLDTFFKQRAAASQRGGGQQGGGGQPRGVSERLRRFYWMEMLEAVAELHKAGDAPRVQRTTDCIVFLKKIYFALLSS